MKKYCFTACFKKKMSDFWKGILATVIIIVVVIIAFAIVCAIAYGIGWTLIEYFNFKGKPLDIGWSAIVLTAISGWLGYWFYRVCKHLSLKTFNFAVDRYEGVPYQCSVFEECKEETENTDVEEK